MGTADSPGFFGPHDNVYIYVPNLIGYGRVLCYIASLCYAFHNKERCLWLYFWGFFGDLLMYSRLSVVSKNYHEWYAMIQLQALLVPIIPDNEFWEASSQDGKAARALGQSSTMGAVLDMVSDRMATTSFLIILSHLYPDLWLFFVSLSILDLSSHWFQMYSALLEKRKSHKDASKSGLFLVNFYYTHYWFFGYCCVGAEVMYLALYLLHDPYYAAKPALPIDGSFLAPLAGSAFNGNLSLVSAIALFCAPGFVTKQIVNVFQLCSSADIIVQYDLAQRKSK